jgi:hypothetical protein
MTLHLPRLSRLLTTVVLALAAPLAMAGDAENSDQRLDLRFTPAEQAIFLADMQVMLGSVQGIVQGMADGDRAAIARFARLSGKRMARATPASIRAKLPPAFTELGAPTHLMFEEIAVRAETDDMDMLARQLAQAMKQCMACHATFKVH